MKIKKSQLKRVIREEMRRLAERTDPSTLDIDPKTMEFTVMAEPDRPGEVGDPRMIRGRIGKHKGRYLPKALSGEEYFDPEHSARQVSGMLSSQLRDLLNVQMVKLGFDAAEAQMATQRVGNSEVMAEALRELLSLVPKVRSQKDKERLKAAVASLVGIKYGFSLPDIDLGEDV